MVDAFQVPYEHSAEAVSLALIADCDYVQLGQKLIFCTIYALGLPQEAAAEDFLRTLTADNNKGFPLYLLSSEQLLDEVTKAHYIRHLRGDDHC